jgi:adenylate cyclase
MLRILKYSAILLLISLLHLYLYTSETIKSFDYKYNDNLNQLLQTKSSADNNVVVVDIDEESLHDFGQWPWPRIITAKLINDIDAMHPTTIAINILFPEKDRTSPVSIQNFYHNFFNLDIGITHLPETLQDNDKLLSDSIKKSQSILSIYFSSEDIEPHCQDLNYTKHQFNNIETTLNAKSIVCNEQQIQQNISNFGFINAQIDNDGLFRRMPLFMNYNNHLVPSFALATLLNIDHNIQNQEKKILFLFLVTPYE